MPSADEQKQIGDLVRSAYDKRAEAIRLEDEAQVILMDVLNKWSEKREKVEENPYKERVNMIEVSQELYHEEMAKAVFEHLRGFLLTKEKNHCQRVEYLPNDVMALTCLRLREDSDLNSHGV